MSQSDPLSFERICSEIRKEAIANGFDNETIEDKLLVLMSEIGEIAEAVYIRKGLAHRKGKEIPSPKKEIVDAFRVIVGLADLEGIDLLLETKNVMWEERDRQYVKGDF